MFKRLRFLFAGLLLAVHQLSGFTIDPFDPKGTLTDSFSTTCLQITQGQQILKSYIMLGMHSRFQDPKKQLSEAIPLYDQRIRNIRDYFQKRLDGHEEAKKAFDTALAAWEENKAMLQKEPNKTDVLKIKKNFQIMAKSLTAGIHPLANEDYKLIKLTGKLCMKPFQITTEYLLSLWGVPHENYEKEITKIIKDYNTFLPKLAEHKLNSPETHALLKKAKSMFMYFEFMHENKKVSIPSLLSQKADKNFQVIRKIKKIFKENLKREKK